MKTKVLALVASLLLAGSLTANAQLSVYGGYSHMIAGDLSAPGFAVGADYGIPLGPVKLFAGARFGLNAKNKVNELNVKESIQFLSLDIPVSVGYPINAGLGLSLVPYLGIDALYYVSGKGTIGNITGNLFSKDDFGDYALKPFHFGAQVGLKMLYEHFMLGIEYRPYFTVLNPSEEKGNRPQYFALNVGWAF